MARILKVKLFCAICIFVQCTGINKTTKIEKNAKNISNRYSVIENKVDTVIFHRDLMCVYVKGNLSEAGRTLKEKKYGYWYYFTEDHKLVSVVNFIDDSAYVIRVNNVSW